MVTGRPHTLRAKRHCQLRLDDLALEIEPEMTALDLIGVRLLVQPPLAALLELEMLDRIGDENLAPVDTRIGKRAVEDAARRPDEWLAGAILLVTRLLAHQHQPRAR